MSLQIPVTSDAVIGHDAAGGVIEIGGDFAYQRHAIVNTMLVGTAEAWVLVDAGMPWSASSIVEAAEARFGPGARPRCIWLTHGHFDHVGALKALAHQWNVRVYAHPLEHPFLNGSHRYPPPKPRLADGLMSLLSPLYPRAPLDLGSHLKPLPPDGAAPDLDGWRWIATPGHSPGHVSYWHPATRRLIAGDAFVTTGQESAYQVARQTPQLHGPPRYFTPDWTAAEASVKALAALDPEMAVTGHGRALGGPAFREALLKLSADFGAVARP